MKKRYMNNKLFYIPQRKRIQSGGAKSSLGSVIGKLVGKGISAAIKHVPKHIVKPILKSSVIQKQLAKASTIPLKSVGSNIVKTAKASGGMGIQKALLGLQVASIPLEVTGIVQSEKSIRAQYDANKPLSRFKPVFV